MNSIVQHFQNGGIAMFLTLGLGICLLIVAGKYSRNGERRLIPLQLSLFLVTLLSGALGFVRGLILTTTFASRLPRDQAFQVVAEGFGESLENISLAIMMSIVAGLVLCAGELRRGRALAV